jgi:lambda family phage portal protein
MAVSTRGTPVLYGADNKPLRIRAQGYDAAGAGRRARNWWPGADSINSVIQGNADVLRNRSRDMVRRNPWASAAKDRYVANIIGTGMVPVSQAEDVALRKEIKSLWDEWCDESDADGNSDFYGQQALGAGQLFEAGDVFYRWRSRLPQDGHSVPIQLQMLEADFLYSNLTQLLPNGNIIRQGIEFNQIGRRVAYYLYKEHPGERLKLSSTLYTRVPADEIIHVFEVMRPGQIRGLPRMSPTLAKLYEIDQYDDAQLVRQKIAALFAFFFTKTVDPMMGAEDDTGDARAQIESIEPGTGYELEPGESVTFPNPPSLGDYDAFIRSQLRQVAGSVDLTYEQLTGDLSNVNYSSIRAGLLEIRRRHELIQHGTMVFQLCRRVWYRWITEAVLDGALPIAASAYLAKPRQFAKAKWIPQGWQWVDPEKEIKAIILAIRSGLMTRSMAVAQYGYDSEEIDAEMAADNERADSLGLRYESDGRVIVQSGQLLGDGKAVAGAQPGGDGANAQDGGGSALASQAAA